MQGCGRTFDEVQHFWPGHAAAQVWRRITLEHTAWRFTRYAERAAEALQTACGVAASVPAGLYAGDQTATVVLCCA